MAKRIQLAVQDILPYKHGIVDGDQIRCVIDKRVFTTYSGSVVLSCPNHLTFARRPNDMLIVELIDGEPHDGIRTMDKQA